MIKRKTIQSSLVLETVNRLQCHPTADEIYLEIIKDYPAISRGTVYRNLQRLCEMGEIRKREIPGGADRFDHLCHDHYHVRCVNCGRVFDVDMEYIPDLEKSIRDAHGFTFTGYDIVFQGTCPECQNHQPGSQPTPEPDKVRPGNAKPGSAKPDSAKPGNAKSGSAKPGSEKFDKALRSAHTGA